MKTRKIKTTMSRRSLRAASTNIGEESIGSESIDDIAVAISAEAGSNACAHVVRLRASRAISAVVTDPEKWACQIPECGACKQLLLLCNAFMWRVTRCSEPRRPRPCANGHLFACLNHFCGGFCSQRHLVCAPRKNCESISCIELQQNALGLHTCSVLLCVCVCASLQLCLC